MCPVRLFLQSIFNTFRVQCASNRQRKQQSSCSFLSFISPRSLFMASKFQCLNEIHSFLIPNPISNEYDKIKIEKKKKTSVLTMRNILLCNFRQINEIFANFQASYTTDEPLQLVHIEIGAQ